MMLVKMHFTEGEFIDTGLPGIFDSEDLCDSLLNIFVSLLADGWQGDPWSKTHETNIGDMDGLAHIYRDGLWLPCISRIALRNQLDVRNDGLPEYAALPWAYDGGFYFTGVKRVPRPKRWAVPGLAQAFYRVTSLANEGAADRWASKGLRVSRQASVPTIRNDLVAVINDKIVPCTLNGLHRDIIWTNWKQVVSFQASACLGVVSDFKQLWNVETGESVIGRDMITPLRLGTSAEQVKSLFYARELPVTETGRKRPILHWVRAHQRRMSDGIEVDINKHLRGITAFDMGGFGFRITSPHKGAA